MNVHDNDDDVSRVMARNAEILECKRRNWTERLAQLESARRQEALLASFDLEPRGTWSKLTDEEKHDKDWVIKGISNGVFGRYQWCKDGYRGGLPLPEQFREDRDVVLAFLTCDDFERDLYGRQFEVPESLRDDKEVMLAVCAKSSFALEVASPRLQDDLDVVSTALGSDESCAQNQLYFASNRLRSDRDFILRQVQRTSEEPHRCDFSWIHHAQLRLEDEKQVALAALKRISEFKSSGHICNSVGIVDYLSPALRDDQDIMLRFVEDHWQNLRDCSNRLKRLEQFVNTAISQNINALKYCFEATKEDIFSKRDKNDVLKDLEVGDLWFESLPKEMKTDPRVLLAALKGGSICFKDLPGNLQREKNFILALPEGPNESYYDNLPEELQKDEELCLQLLKKYYGWPKAILDKVPLLYRSREAIIAAAKIFPGPTVAGTKVFGDTSKIREIIQNCSFRDDDEVMLLACEKNIKCLEYASERLKSNRGFVQSVLSRDSAGIFYVSHDFQVNNIDLVLEAIERSGDRNSFTAYKIIYGDVLVRDLWQDRSIVVACLKKGWPILRNLDREGPLLDDAELVRLAMEKCTGSLSELQYASSSLRTNRDFARSVVKINGLSLSYVDTAFKRDDEIVTEAIANTPNTILDCFRSEEDFGCLVSFAASVRSRLELHKSFLNDFLRGISVSRPHVAPAKRCHLPILDRGSETSTAFKKLIAEYLGVPMKRELRLLRTTSENLRKLRY